MGSKRKNWVRREGVRRFETEGLSCCSLSLGGSALIKPSTGLGFKERLFADSLSLSGYLIFW